MPAGFSAGNLHCNFPAQRSIKELINPDQTSGRDLVGEINDKRSIISPESVSKIWKMQFYRISLQIEAKNAGTALLL